MALFPDLRLGIGVLINSSKVGSALNLSVLTSRLVDHYLGVASGDDEEQMKASYARRKARDDEAERALLASRRPDTHPSAPLSGSVGTFRDRLGLDVVVSHEGSALGLQYGGGERAALEPWHDDTFRVRWHNPWHDADQQTLVSFSPTRQRG